MDRDTVGACVSAAFFHAGLEKAGLAEVLEAWGEVEVSPTEWLRVQDQSLALQQLQAKVPL